MMRGLRGALSGRAEVGIFLCTSAFTREAEAEAYRIGATPITLFSGSRLVEECKTKHFCVDSVYEINETDFAKFEGKAANS